MKQSFLILALFISLISVEAQTTQHTFELGETTFLLDKHPYQVISGELHPARIPREYWQHRIQMAKAMGCNTIACYIFWNYHEARPGTFDFKTENRNIAEFIRLAQREGMWVLLRPGPYVCAEWDLGGLPHWLLATPDIKVRCMDSTYMRAVRKYIKALADEVRSLQITQGGPILMLQIENEYGSFGNDRNYLEALRQEWRKEGINIPFYTSDGATPYMLEAGSLPGAAVGLDPGWNDESFQTASKARPGVPVFSSETYPGWLTHWGEAWARPDTADLMNEVKFLLDNKKSFNFYVIHGGTNFGFAAGANSGGKGYEPDITSYDYDAPINEQGRATAKYYALRNLISQYRKDLPGVPAPIPAMEIPEFSMQIWTSLSDHLPPAEKSVQPKTFEYYGQYHGLIIYKTQLTGHKSGKLVITDLHDFATVFLNGRYIGSIDRRLGENSLQLPATQEAFPTLEIRVESMGRINYGQQLIDRKGITDRVTLNGMTLMNWDIFRFPLEDEWIRNLTPGIADTASKGLFFKGNFPLDHCADTYIDLKNYTKGVVWINGHNLGRFWNIGPQYRLYCPASWLKTGLNEIVVFDLLQTEAKPVSGYKTPE